MTRNDNGRMTPALPDPVPLIGSLRLADWGLIRVQGADAAEFLHSQLTQDVTGLPADEARLAGYCSAKGRLLASFLIWRESADSLLLACSADLLAPTMKRLSMFVLRAKAKLSDVSSELALHGIAGDPFDADSRSQPWTVARDAGIAWVRLPDADGLPRWLRCAPADAPAPAGDPLPPEAWAFLEVRSAVPRITAATVEQFVPQMVNLEALDGVNFKKGCYPGQEVVARSQYRGTIKRRSQLFSAGAGGRPGQEVFHDADPSQPAGLVVNAASFDGRHAVLAEVKLAALDSGTLHLGEPGGPAMVREELPYALPLGVA